MLLEKIGQLPDRAATFRGGHARPWALVEGAPRGEDGPVDVFRFGFRNFGDHVASGGVEDRKILAGSCCNEAAVDVHLVVLGDKIGGGAADAWIDRNGGHILTSGATGRGQALERNEPPKTASGEKSRRRRSGAFSFPGAGARRILHARTLPPWLVHWRVGHLED